MVLMKITTRLAAVQGGGRCSQMQAQCGGGARQPLGRGEESETETGGERETEVGRETETGERKRQGERQKWEETEGQVGEERGDG